MKNLVYGIIAVGTLLISGCSQRSTNNEINPHLKYSKNIVSTRAQNSTHFIAIVKLKTPALFETQEKEKNKAKVNAELLAGINKEQEEFIQAVQELSGEVQVLYRYKMVLNAVAVLAPIELAEKIKGLGQVAYSESSGNFSRPKTFELSNSVTKPSFNERNSSKFIGAEKLNLSGITGKGMKVGIIDTGIDFTHAMFKGTGTEEAFKAVNPAAATDLFPNAKVVGGVDFVGTEFDSASPDFSKHIPKPDMNPIDEAGHGTHVAGTVAGIGDGVNTYNGMAPDADLYALKVFGADGSTSDAAIIAALEYSADPNADGENADQLDIVNLSLGSSYGNPHILYTEAIKNLVNGGVLVVASAGNSGHQNYIVGAPGTSDEALSVAASIDNGDHLWKFSSCRLNLGSEKIYVEAIEAASTKKISEITELSGKLVYVGTAAQDLTEDQIQKLKGNVAFIDRGQISFNDKIKKVVAAGVIGVVVANNKDEAAFVMGTTDEFSVPAIMITLKDANKVKEAMKLTDVSIDYKTDHKIEKPQLIDTLTDFTSKGPRSIDGFIKPEISAPGENVISAAMGGGAKAVQMSGTSMAAPHMAGVMALVKQAHPDLSAEDLKSVVMGTSKMIGQAGVRYPISMQGAGRIQADKAAEAKVLVKQASISLGEVGIESKKIIRKTITLKNLTSEKQNLKINFEGNGFMSMASLKSLSLDPKASQDVVVDFTLDAANMKEDNIREMDGWIKISKDTQELYRVPVLAVAHKLSALEATSLVVRATSENDAEGALTQLVLANKNNNIGEALLFNMIGKEDERKPKADSYMNADCDLQSAGYRILSKKNEEGKPEDVLQVAIKLFKPMTTWHSCDVSILIDSDQDGKPEQELLGSSLSSIAGQKEAGFATTLLDATKARNMRAAFEKALAEAKDDPKVLAELKESEDYTAAILEQRGLAVYDNSTVMVLEVAGNKLSLTKEGAVSFKVLVSHNEQSSVESDDYLSSNLKTDMQISLIKKDQSYLDLPESVMLAGVTTKTLDLVKGAGLDDLLVLLPTNKFSQSNLHKDGQAQVLKPVYSLK